MLTTVPNNLNNLTHTSGYRFSGLPEGSLLYQVRVAINNSNRDSWFIAAACDEYICERTVANLMNGKTKRPQLRTVQLIMKALGYQLRWSRLD